MTRTSRVIVVSLPTLLPGQVVTQFEESVYSASHAELEDGMLSFWVGPTWFNSPTIHRHVSVVQLRARLKQGYMVAGYIEKLGKRWKVMVEVSNPPKK
ncbi:MAG: hypothetical protein ACM3NH_02060 [Candidatus Saccharibacteria bacterium]